MKAKVVDLKGLKEGLINVIKQDKKTYKRGIIRYELMKNLSGEINCIDRHDFKQHTYSYNSQGFYEHKRIKKMLKSIPCELVVMRHKDNTKRFEQYDGLLTGYLKADCELCYYEVIL